MFLPIQSAAANPLAIAGTFASFALFLSITAHVAARNVLGDVPVRNALLVGPVPAAISVLVATFAAENPPVLFAGLAAALVLDGAAVKYAYGESTGLSAYVALIHFVVSVILGTVIFGILALATSAPG